MKLLICLIFNMAILAQQGCLHGAQCSTYTFHLSERKIVINGVGVAGNVKSSPGYNKADVYAVIADVVEVDIEAPSPSLSGGVKYTLVVRAVPSVDGTYHLGDRFIIWGAIDGTTNWVQKGIRVEVYFFRGNNKFVDLVPSSSGNQ
jgi:hypothetical protein